jgi:kynurenine formamidase
VTGPLPAYRDLPRIAELGARHAWQAFEAGDEIGRIGLLDAAAACRGAREVRRGAIFNLCLPLSLPDPPLTPRRRQYTHHVGALGRNVQDDYLTDFFLQASSQWDGLRHVRAREFGFFGGRGTPGEPSDVGLGIDKWAEHGIVGRGVLADVQRHLTRQGRPLRPGVGTAITATDLREVLRAQGATLERGDVLIVRTGFVEAYLQAQPDERQRWATETDCPGLHAGEEMAEFLWDAGVAAIAADNPAVEVIPGDVGAGSLHRRLIPLLGFALGELFHVGPLAADCAADGRYACMFAAAPLNVPGAVGSPANAIAVK